jgi:hypothetical protein
VEDIKAGRWLDVNSAAEELGVSTDAVRKRISRGTLHSDRKDGTVRVWLDDGGTEAGREAQVDGGALVEVLREQAEYLREQLAEEREARRRADSSPRPTPPSPLGCPSSRHRRSSQEPPRRSRRSRKGRSPGPPPQALRRAHGDPGGAGRSAPSGGSMGLHRHRFGAAGALDRARLVDRPVRRVGAGRLLRLSRQGVSQGA